MMIDCRDRQWGHGPQGQLHKPHKVLNRNNYTSQEAHTRQEVSAARQHAAERRRC